MADMAVEVAELRKDLERIHDLSKQEMSQFREALKDHSQSLREFSKEFKQGASIMVELKESVDSAHKRISEFKAETKDNYDKLMVRVNKIDLDTAKNSWGLSSNAKAGAIFTTLASAILYAMVKFLG